jgi:hypothetical protein
MEETYDAHGVRFRYPEEWELTEQRRGDEFLITVSSPETSFWTLGLFYDHPSPEAVVETVVDALREDYEDLDDYDVIDAIGGQPTVARDVEFFCVELLNSAWIRSFATPRFTLLVFYQANDLEAEVTGPIFEQILNSLSWDGDDDAPFLPWNEPPGITDESESDDDES